jgi:hypothetical protein
VVLQLLLDQLQEQDQLFQLLVGLGVLATTTSCAEAALIPAATKMPATLPSVAGLLLPRFMPSLPLS